MTVRILCVTSICKNSLSQITTSANVNWGRMRISSSLHLVKHGWKRLKSRVTSPKKMWSASNKAFWILAWCEKSTRCSSNLFRPLRLMGRVCSSLPNSYSRLRRTHWLILSLIQLWDPMMAASTNLWRKKGIPSPISLRKWWQKQPFQKTFQIKVVWRDQNSSKTKTLAN